MRRWAVYSTIFILIEAAIGAMLVLFRWVAANESLARAFVQPIHLVNTFLLLGALVSAVYFAQNKTNNSINWQTARPFLFGLALLCLVGAFGAIASLASTLFPSDTFIDGLQKDFANDSHYLIRLRVWHPIVAILTSIFIAWQVNNVTASSIRAGRKLSTIVTALIIAQFILGALNAILVAPIPLQLSHLLLSDLLLIAYTWFALEIVTLVPQTSTIQHSFT